MSLPILSFMGVKIIESALMVDRIHVGTWLNGYQASRHRSERCKKKLLWGTRKRRPRVSAMIEVVPKREMYQLPTGELVGHPATIAEVRRQMNELGAQLGFRP